MKDPLHSIFFLALFSLLFYGLWAILSPFAGAMLGALILVVLFYPLHDQFRQSFRMGETTRALCTTIIVSLLFIAPTLLVCWSIVHEAQELAQLVGNARSHFEEWSRNGTGLGSPWFQEVQTVLYKAFGMRKVDMQKSLYNAAHNTLASVGSVGAGAARNIFGLVIQLMVMLVTLFFFFRDGEDMFDRLKRWIPMKDRDKTKIADQLHLTMTEVVRGTLVTAGVQGLCASAGFLVVGAPAAITLGFLSFLTALIPFAGAFAVWFPVSLGYFLQGMHAKGLFLLLWGGLVVSLVDNFLRPFLIGNKIHMPFLYLFIAVLGGMDVFGFKGLLLGPVIVALVPVFMEIYKDRYGSGIEENTL